MLRLTRKIESANLVRNFVFGVEDSLVSTVGLLSGVAIARPDLKTLLLAGIVLIFVEAFSMGVGSSLSENAAAEFVTGKESSLKSTFVPGMTMFVSYFIAGLIPLAPYVIFVYPLSFWISIGFSISGLFCLGYISAILNNTKRVSQAMEMAVIGGCAVLLGVGVGSLVNSIL